MVKRIMVTAVQFSPIQSTLRLGLVGLMAAGLAACGGGSRGPTTGPTTTPGGPITAQVPEKAVYKVGAPYQINGVTYYPSEDFNYDESGVASWYGPGFHAKLTANGEDYDQNEMTAAHRTLPMPSFVRVTNLDNGRTVVLRINDRGPYARGRIIDISRRGAQLLGFDQAGTARVRVQVLTEESRQIADALRSQGRTASDAASKGSGTLIARVTPPPTDPKANAAPRSSVAVERLDAPSGVKTSPIPGGSPPPGTGQAPITGTQPVIAPPPDPTGPGATTTPKRTQLFVQVAALSSESGARVLSERLNGYGFGKVVVQPIVAASGQRLQRVRIGPLASVDDGDRTLDDVINRGGYPDARLVVE
ncbi:MAG: septal ring lytic transglycosylase RlpA family protein [Elstera sp.]